MNPIAEDILQHVGTPRHSGRYPWGSGKVPFQRSGDFLSRVEELKKGNFEFEDEDGKVWTGDMAISKYMGLSSTEFRTQKALASAERRAPLYEKASALREKGYSLNQIAEEMGYKSDSSVRSLLNEGSKARMNQAMTTAEFLKKQVDEKGMIDVGVGIERELGLNSREKMKEALYILQREGYEVYGGGVPQATNPGRQTNLQVLCPPGTQHKEIFNFENINQITEYKSHDGGDTFDTFVYPKSMDSKRIKIRYAEEGGIEKDGLVELRRGVDDISLGGSKYAQVRILVDDKSYIKGMAVYSDNLPDGTDLIFNTNKALGTPKEKVLKTIKDDPDNPFGSLIKAGGQNYYVDSNGERQLSLINKRAEEGDWDNWKDGLPSQFLSKQSRSLMKKQLGLAIDDKQAEFDKIMALNNPTLKKALLKSFSDDCDSAAIHLQAASLPRQKYQVIIPITSLKDNEVFAPNYENGEQVSLVRFPHGGTFEIPVLTVNRKNKEALKMLSGTPLDVIGINSKVAERLSGADFDGDTVLVIPTNAKTKITSTPPLRGLIGFDPKTEYGYDEVRVDSQGKEHYYRNGREFKTMNNTQTEMGMISNLITDMTIKGAHDDELARAVKHSMVVIDAEKHKLDYKSSATKNQIASLKKEYQGHYDEDGKFRTGASTIISRAKSKEIVAKRKGSPKVNTPGKEWYDPSRPEGSLIWNSVDEEYKVFKKLKDPDTGKFLINPDTGKVLKEDTGKVKKRTQPSTKMAETDDAFTLVSDADTQAERIYAQYANKMKSMANEARKNQISAGKIQYNKAAKQTYQKEVDSLNAQLNVALKNAPRERQAQLIVKSIVDAKVKANPDITESELKKMRQMELTKARNKVGAKRTLIDVSDREWEAIQSGAISENILMKIINNIDTDKLRERATPNTPSNSLRPFEVTRMKSLNASGYTTNEIAKALGVSTSTIIKYLKG